jgi:hypothetical protein
MPRLTFGEAACCSAFLIFRDLLFLIGRRA